MNSKTRRGGGKRRRPPFRKRHPVVTSLIAAVIVLPVAAVGYFAWNLNHQLDKLERVKVENLADRPDPAPGRALNFLLLGSDKAEGADKNSSVAQDAKASEWPVGKYRSDTIMIAHITEKRDKVFLVSIPRDSFVMIYDAQGNPTSEAKINAAFSQHGPLGAISTIENLSGLRMDHLTIIDWDGFKDLSEAVGGVPVTIPETFYDSKQDITWEAGRHVLRGSEALAYVRTRYGLGEGDFDRIRRQQNFMRSLMGKMLNSGVTSNPVTLTNTVSALAENLTVDDKLSNDAIRGLALSLRGVSVKDVTFLTAPVAGLASDPTWGSIVRLEADKTAALFEAIRTESLESYVLANPDDLLPDRGEIR